MNESANHQSAHRRVAQASSPANAKRRLPAIPILLGLVSTFLVGSIAVWLVVSYRERSKILSGIPEEIRTVMDRSPAVRFIRSRASGIDVALPMYRGDLAGHEGPFCFQMPPEFTMRRTLLGYDVYVSTWEHENVKIVHGGPPLSNGHLTSLSQDYDARDATEVRRMWFSALRLTTVDLLRAESTTDRERISSLLYWKAGLLESAPRVQFVLVSRDDGMFGVVQGPVELDEDRAPFWEVRLWPPGPWRSASAAIVLPRSILVSIEPEGTLDGLMEILAEVRFAEQP